MLQFATEINRLERLIDFRVKLNYILFDIINDDKLL